VSIKFTDFHKINPKSDIPLRFPSGFPVKLTWSSKQSVFPEEATGHVFSPPFHVPKSDVAVLLERKAASFGSLIVATDDDGKPKGQARAWAVDKDPFVQHNVQIKIKPNE
jgi:hypothetical protein